jgi:branched-chain amino acid transport system substrate-binding protein
MLALMLIAAPLRVAAVFNLSGDMASVDGPGWRGMRLAAEEINHNGGVNGRRVELVLVDGRSNPKRAAAETERILRQGRVDAVAGLYDSDYALPVGKVAQRYHVPFVTSGATLPGLTKMIGDHAFMACYGDDDQAEAMSQFAWKHLGARTAATFTDRHHAYPRALGSHFVADFERRGGRIVTGVGQSPADAMYLAIMPEDAGKMVRTARKLGFAGPILSGDGFDTPDLARVAGADSRAVYFTTHVAYDEPAPRIRSFVRDFRARYGHGPGSASAALAYDSLRLIAEAARRQGAGSLRNAIAATRGFAGVTGRISFTATSREPRKPITVVQLVNGKPVFETEIEP